MSQLAAVARPPSRADELKVQIEIELEIETETEVGIEVEIEVEAEVEIEKDERNAVGHSEKERGEHQTRCSEAEGRDQRSEETSVSRTPRSFSGGSRWPIERVAP